jgi:hypothetical protein
MVIKCQGSGTLLEIVSFLRIPQVANLKIGENLGIRPETFSYELSGGGGGYPPGTLGVDP